MVVLQWGSPFQCLFNRTPNYDCLCTFGCRCFPHLVPYRTNKLYSKTKSCIFIGYSDSHKRYKCLNPDTSQVYIFRHVVFDESLFPYASFNLSSTLPPSESPPEEWVQLAWIVPSSSSPSLTFTPTNETQRQAPIVPPSLQTYARHKPGPRSISILENPAPQRCNDVPPPTQIQRPSSPTNCHTLEPSQIVPILPPATPVSSAAPVISNAPTHTMVTHSKNGTQKAKVHNYSACISKYPILACFLSEIANNATEPTCYTQASRDPRW